MSKTFKKEKSENSQKRTNYKKIREKVTQESQKKNNKYYWITDDGYDDFENCIKT